MPSLIELRRRSGLDKNMGTITKALKVVSAANVRRAQDRVLSGRPYAEIIQRMLANVAQAASERHDGETIDLLVVRPEKRIQLLVITADRGLAGAFNSNVLKAALKFIQDHKDAEVQLELIGRKSRDFFKKRSRNISGEYAGIFQKTVPYDDRLESAQKGIERVRKAE